MSLKCHRLDLFGSFYQKNTTLAQESCEVTLEVAKQKTSRDWRNTIESRLVEKGTTTSWIS